MDHSSEHDFPPRYDPPPQRYPSRRGHVRANTDDVLPRYPSSTGITSTPDVANSVNQSSSFKDAAKRRESIGGGAMNVDGFQYELGRLMHEITDVDEKLNRLGSLSTSADGASKDMSRLSDTVVDRLPSIISTLRSLAAKAPYLGGSAGRAFVTTDESNGVKSGLYEVARSLKDCIYVVETGVAREKLDEGSSSIDHLPYTEIYSVCLANVDLTFLDKVLAEPVPKAAFSSTSGFKPLNYATSIGSVASFEQYPSYQKPDDDDARGLLAPGSTGFGEIKPEDAVGAWGEPLVKKEKEARFRPRVLVWVGLLVLAIVGASLGVYFVVKMSHGGTASGEQSAAEGTTLYIAVPSAASTTS